MSTVNVGTVGHINYARTEALVAALELLDAAAERAADSMRECGKAMRIVDFGDYEPLGGYDLSPPEPAHMKFVRAAARQQRRRSSR